MINIVSMVPDYLFIYNERKLENDIPDHAGATLSDGIKTLQTYRLCSEAK